MPLIIRTSTRGVYPPRTPKPEPIVCTPHGQRRRCDMKRWTPADDALVLKCYDHADPDPLAIKLGRTVAALRTRACFLRAQVGK